MNDDGFWTGYAIGKNDDKDNSTANGYFLLLIIYAPMFFISYEIGKMLSDMNVVKWGFVLAAIFVVLVPLNLLLWKSLELLLDLLLDSKITSLFNEKISMSFYFIYVIVFHPLLSYSLVRASNYIFINEGVREIASFIDVRISAILSWLF